jgi:hypothetical protein
MGTSAPSMRRARVVAETGTAATMTGPVVSRGRGRSPASPHVEHDADAGLVGRREVQEHRRKKRDEADKMHAIDRGSGADALDDQRAVCALPEERRSLVDVAVPDVVAPERNDEQRTPRQHVAELLGREHLASGGA